MQVSFSPKGIHPPSPMMHIAYSFPLFQPNLSKFFPSYFHSFWLPSALTMMLLRIMLKTYWTPLFSPYQKEIFKNTACSLGKEPQTRWLIV